MNMRILFTTLFIVFINGNAFRGVVASEELDDMTKRTTTLQIIDEHGCFICDDNCDFGNEKDDSGCDICGECKTEGVLEGDILISSESYPEYVRLYGGEDCETDQERSLRGAITGERFKWPKSSDGNVYVPYTFENNVSTRKRERIQAVFEEYKDRTCIRFTPRSSQREYLRIDGTGGCSSYVGRQQQFRDGQVVKIGNGCDNAKGTIIHELMHALGFWHEQSRGDRDQYVTINFHNIRQGAEGNFRKQTNFDAYNTEYDVNSVMHYGGTFFSKNGQPTIVRRGSNEPITANRRDFSNTDLQEINRRYECSEFLGGGNRPVTTRPPVTTRRPSVGGSGGSNCRDSSSNCEFWVRQRYCVQDYISFMQRNCPQSCGFCRTPSTPRPTNRPVETRPTLRPTTAGSCRNKLSSCNQLRNRCTSSENWRRFMRENCPVTCNFCGTVTTRPPRPVTTPSSSCRDTHDNCNYWLERNYCNSANFERFMRQSCRRTCGFCGSTGPVATPRPTRPTSRNYQCGRPTVEITLLRRIVGGSEADYGSIPWIVSLRRGNDYDFCAGTLISDRFILTAAHCFYRGDTFDDRVDHMHGYVGKHQRRGSRRDEHQQRVTFRRVIKFPEYHHPTSDNDIALLELSSPVRFTDYVKPACLPSPREPAVPSTVGLIAGWGDTEEDGFPDVLHKVNVEIISNDNCNRWLRRRHNNGRDEVTSNMFCAGYQRGGRDACQGDSGGPLTVRRDDGSNVLTGIISWGYGCADVERPGVYAKVSNYINWINRNTQ